jgi:hypothetical protein
MFHPQERNNDTRERNFSDSNRKEYIPYRMDGWLAGWVDDVDEDETDAVCGVCFGCVITIDRFFGRLFFQNIYYNICISIDQ